MLIKISDGIFEIGHGFGVIWPGRGSSTGMERDEKEVTSSDMVEAEDPSRE